MPAKKKTPKLVITYETPEDTILAYANGFYQEGLNRFLSNQSPFIQLRKLDHFVHYVKWSWGPGVLDGTRPPKRQVFKTLTLIRDALVQLWLVSRTRKAEELQQKLDDEMDNIALQPMHEE